MKIDYKGKEPKINKKCTNCGQIKPLISFHKQKDKKDGRRCHCALCVNKKYSIWQKSNRDKCNKKLNRWYRANREKGIQYVLDYGKRNPGKINALTAKRRAAKLQRTPKWLSTDQLKEIQQFYIDSTYLTFYTRTDFNVDHIIPLQGELVSGLHVPWNLQILTKAENCRKYNNL